MRSTFEELPLYCKREVHGPAVIQLTLHCPLGSEGSVSREEATCVGFGDRRIDVFTLRSFAS
jgi:hypothetical protein